VSERKDVLSLQADVKKESPYACADPNKEFREKWKAEKARKERCFGLGGVFDKLKASCSDMMAESRKAALADSPAMAARSRTASAGLSR
jgi:hypothetical protein